MKRIGEATAHEAKATGIPYTFAPCIVIRVVSYDVVVTIFYEPIAFSCMYSTKFYLF